MYARICKKQVWHVCKHMGLISSVNPFDVFLQDKSAATLQVQANERYMQRICKLFSLSCCLLFQIKMIWLSATLKQHMGFSGQKDYML